MFSSVSSYLHIFLLAFLSLYLFWCYISFNWTIKFNFLLKLSIVFLIRVFIYGSKMNNWIMFIYIKYIVFKKNYPGPCHKAWLWAHDWRKGLIAVGCPQTSRFHAVDWNFEIRIPLSSVSQHFGITDADHHTSHTKQHKEFQQW